MKNSLTYSKGLLTIIAATSLLIVAALESDNTTLNNTLLNNTTLGNMSLNFSASNNTALNATNETFMIGGGIDSNKSAFNVSSAIKPIKDASKLGYIIQSTPHGKV
jgi:hypothetical protein